MQEDDTRVYWELMFLHFHGMQPADLGRFLGQGLRDRYEVYGGEPPGIFDELLARLDRAEATVGH